MTIRIVQADLDAHREVLIEAISRFLTPLSDNRRYEWLYRRSPYGEAQVWMALQSGGDDVVGAAAAFPRRFYVGDDERLGWVLGDFCLDPRYRSLGPALQLQRACLGLLESDNACFFYDFPSASMVAIYNRLKVGPSTRMVRLAKLLRVDRKVRQMNKIPVAQRAVAAVGNTLLKFASPKITSDNSLEIALYQGECGKEFSVLAQGQRGSLGICVQRSAEYLNWRYMHNPLARYEFITARRCGSLKGYAIWTQAGEDATVVDLFGHNDPAMGKALLAEIIRIAGKRGVMTLSIGVNESHPWLSWFSQAGFRVRESAPVMIVPSPTFSSGVKLESNGWFLMQGDRDS